MIPNASAAAPHLRFRVDPAWTPQAIEKARAFEVSKYLGAFLAETFPHLLPYLSPILERLAPLRLGHGCRMLRAWGRNYPIKPEETEAIKLLVDGYYQGTRCIGLPDEMFAGSKALEDGIIKRADGMFWLEEPEEEKHRPVLVMFPELVSSKEYSETSVDDGTGAGKGKGKKKQIKPRKCTLALMYLHEHPDWTDYQIAEAAGCDRASLYRFKGFQKAKAAMKAVREEYRQWDQGEGQWKDED